MATTREVAEARYLRDVHGLKVIEISVLLGYSRKTIAQWLDERVAAGARRRNRRWKREHKDQEVARLKIVRRQNRRPCPECGRKMGIGSEGKRCIRCVKEERHFRFKDLERLWGEGLSVGEIGEKMGLTSGSVYCTVDRARSAGYDLPYRSSHPRARHPRLVKAERLAQDRSKDGIGPDLREDTLTSTSRSGYAQTAAAEAA